MIKASQSVDDENITNIEFLPCKTKNNLNKTNQILLRSGAGLNQKVPVRNKESELEQSQSM